MKKLIFLLFILLVSCTKERLNQSTFLTGGYTKAIDCHLERSANLELDARPVYHDNQFLESQLFSDRRSQQQFNGQNLWFQPEGAEYFIQINQFGEIVDYREKIQFYQFYIRRQTVINGDTVQIYGNYVESDLADDKVYWAYDDFGYERLEAGQYTIITPHLNGDILHIWDDTGREAEWHTTRQETPDLQITISEEGTTQSKVCDLPYDTINIQTPYVFLDSGNQFNSGVIGEGIYYDRLRIYPLRTQYYRIYNQQPFEYIEIDQEGFMQRLYKC